MAQIDLNGECFEAPEGANLLLTAHERGVQIPHLCYHPGLSPPVNCRLCLVAVGVGEERRLVPACDLQVTEGLAVDTLAEDVIRKREEALEFLLVGHALDCPVCAKSGECEIQNYVFAHGREQGRYTEKHPARAKVDLGPRIQFHADRCIGCTRCIRFCDEVSQSGELARVGRGAEARIEVFPGRQLDNPLAGNLIDLCPVGALVEKDAHLGPPVWQLESVDSVCPGCSTGCNIRVDVQREKIIRIKPRFNPELNQYWLCDEGRYGWEYVARERRLDCPQIRRGEQLEKVSWEEALAEVDERLGSCASGTIAASFSASATNEESFLFASLARDIWKTGWVSLRTCRAPGGDQIFGQHFIVRADKAPNTRGAREIASELGIEVLPEDRLWREMAAGRIAAAFLLVGHPGAEISDIERQALAQVDFLVVQSAFESELSRMAAVVLPGTTAFEKEGSFTNSDGLVQRSRRVLAPPGSAWPDWQILARLGKVAGLDWEYGHPLEIAMEVGRPYVAAMRESAERRSGQAYGGGWATWLQRRGFIHVEDHTKER